jgi:DNA ligase (NAD+)
MDYITKFWDIFRLKNYRDEILLLDGFKEKSVNNLLDGIEKVRDTDIVTFLKALWIPGVGKKTAKTLASYLTLTLSLEERGRAAWDLSMKLYLSWQERIKRGVMIWDLEELPDIWPEVAWSVVEFFTEQSELAQDLLREVNITFPDISNSLETSWKYAWKKMCITGSFDWYKREWLAEMLEAQGGEFMSSVSVKTDYLLAWDKAWSKLKKAQELWVEVLSVEEFLES